MKKLLIASVVISSAIVPFGFGMHNTKKDGQNRPSAPSSSTPITYYRETGPVATGPSNTSCSSSSGAMGPRVASNHNDDNKAAEKLAQKIKLATA